MDYQIGGDHYMKYEIQPMDVYVRLGLDALRGNILKYLVRWKDKNGIEDLKKALQYAEVMEAKKEKDKEYIDEFLKQFIKEDSNYDNEALPIIYTLLHNESEYAGHIETKIKSLIEKEERKNQNNADFYSIYKNNVKDFIAVIRDFGKCGDTHKMEYFHGRVAGNLNMMYATGNITEEEHDRLLGLIQALSHSSISFSVIKDEDIDRVESELLGVVKAE